MRCEKILNIDTDATERCFLFSDYSENNGIATLNVEIDTDDNKENAVMAFRTEDADAYSFWSPLKQYTRTVVPDWTKGNTINSRANRGFPLVQYIDKAGNNVCLFSVADFLSELTIKCGIEERTGKIRFTVTVKAKPGIGFKAYNTEVYCDKRHIPYYEAISEYNRYLRQTGIVPAYVPEQARRRLYSTWYDFQKGVSQEEAYKQCVLAQQYGMNTVIIDDGWQTPVCNQFENAYIDIGDWEPYAPKFPDMRGFVDKLHDRGMKVILWIAVPFIGRESKVYEFFDGRFLSDKNPDGTVKNADPRYPDIRKWYVDFLSERMQRWNLDGFKLDFIDRFEWKESSRTDYENMDIPNVGEAANKLLEEIKEALVQINPEVMLEYRQSYIGPKMQATGNLIRVGDCAYGAMHNKVNGIDLRLAAPDTAIHSDMLMWDYDTTPEGAAGQLSACLFIVPQVSMFFDRLPESHKKVLKFYLDFIDENRDVLQKGKLVPLRPEAFYSVVYAEKEGKVIAALYSENLFEVPEGAETLTLVNITGTAKVYVNTEKAGLKGKAYTVKNCMGEVTETGTVENDLACYEIPFNGMMFVQ